MCKVILNNELNGVELYFEGKPMVEVLNNLKDNKFRWNRTKKCWYAKQNENSIKVAEMYGNIETEVHTIKGSKVIDLWKLCDISDINNINNISVDGDFKDFVKSIRTHLNKRFPFVKWSVRKESYKSIDVTVKSSPFSKESEILKSICNYANNLVNNYFDSRDSDIMTDYFNYNFYFSNTQIDYDYKIIENSLISDEVINKYNESKKNFEKSEKERKEKEFQEYLKQEEIRKAEYEKRMEEEKKQVKSIEQNTKVIKLSEDKQYFIKNSLFSHSNKLCWLSEYKKHIENKDYYLQDCKVTKEIHMDKEDLNNFENLLLNDFSFLKCTGGSYTDDLRINSMEDYTQMTKEERKTVKFNSYVVAVYCENKLQFIIDAQGFSYARYVGLIGEETTIEKQLIYNQQISKEEAQENENKSNELIYIINNTVNNISNIKTYGDEWYNTRNKIINNIKSADKHITKEIIRSIKETKENYIIYKDILYRCINEVNTPVDQSNNINNGWITIIKESMIGGAVITYLNVIDKQVNNNDLILIGKVENKKGLYQININEKDNSTIIYNGKYNIDESLLYNITTGEYGTTKSTKYSSYDKQAIIDIIEYLKYTYNILPALNMMYTII